MEANEIQATWRQLEQALNRGNRLNHAMLRQHKLEAMARTLRPLKLNQAFQIAWGIGSIVLAGLLWATGPTAASVIVAGVVVQAYGIGCIVTAGLVFAALRRIDYAAPIVEVQSDIAQVRRAYGVCVLVAGLAWWFLWIPVLMLLAGLGHINLYAQAPSVVWIGTAVGLAGVSAMYWMYRYSLQSSNAGLRKWMERTALGASLQKARQQLEEVRRFEEEWLA